MFECSDLHKTYETAAGRVEALRGIDLSIARGRVFGIIGRSGAGKSTLLRCANLLERPTRGTVTFDGVELTRLDAPALRAVRRRIGMIFQHFALLSSRTVAQNVALPLELAGVARAAQAGMIRTMLEFVGLWDLRDRYPAQLSGGQAQRVGIARALVNAPELLLCDEATSALDPQTTQSILELLREVNARLGVTILLITHEMGVIKAICDDVAVIDAGRIVESGSVRDVFLQPRTDLTKALIGEPSGADLAALLGAPIAAEPGFAAGERAVWRLAFGSAVRDAVITTLARRFPIDLTIVRGAIETIGGAPLGTLVVEVAADPATRAAAAAYLHSLDVRVDVLGYVERAFIAAS